MNAAQEFPFRSVLIFGMGMMGASLALAIRKKTAGSVRIDAVVRSTSSAAYIREAGLADQCVQVHAPEEVAGFDFSPYDLIVLGVPPRTIEALLPSFPACKAVFTDLSSTRRAVHAAFARRPDLDFVGSHPMCGSENQGAAHGQAELYAGRLCLLLCDEHARPQSIEAITQLWRSLGMHTGQIPVAAHDEVLAFLSHAPHVLSSLLTLWAESSERVRQSSEQTPIPITGGGFKDMSRIAGSNPEMWTDIMLTNGDHVREALRAFHGLLGELLQEFDGRTAPQWQEWFRSARLARNRLCGYEKDL
ncbi:MAG: prephenate dehydrogenase/arogenate dehydrogenase family protein [Spirochaetales bacterium]|nr:prephenate dehydrogenase/arogenate dehydrogenase family protein [Leptospiraceae bacterium]MCP5482749.1 prephenate dehydrogenase/arogenate dehydrogenase family protein [Spirochaetales bacterium]MCP5485243.1 prephenate dehydrogenase/arogenate dehydrogenase family protein [Spirochaetales bacterium]